MKIVLLGYMGSGKTTVGRILAERNKLQFQDLDDIISEREQQSISQLFSSKGEIYFRKKETEYLKEMLEANQKAVLTLGGGTPCYGMNMAFIKESGWKSVYLKTSIPTLVQRLRSESEQRPLISHLKSDEELTEFIGKHLFERSFYYDQASFKINTDHKTFEQLVKDIEEVLSL